MSISAAPPSAATSKSETATTERVERQSRTSAVANTKNGNRGIPGKRPMKNIMPAAMIVAFGLPPTWAKRLWLRLPLPLFLVTSTAAEVEMKRAGI